MFKDKRICVRVSMKCSQGMLKDTRIRGACHSKLWDIKVVAAIISEFFQGLPVFMYNRVSQWIS
jgi:hypothetical protein